MMKMFSKLLLLSSLCLASAFSTQPRSLTEMANGLKADLEQQGAKLPKEAHELILRTLRETDSRGRELTSRQANQDLDNLEQLHGKQIQELSDQLRKLEQENQILKQQLEETKAKQGKMQELQNEIARLNQQLNNCKESLARIQNLSEEALSRNS